MKIVLNLIFYLLPLIVAAKSNFFIEGSGKVFKDGDKIYLTYKQAGRTVFDSTICRFGKFKFSKLVTEVSLGYICKNENPMQLETITDPIHFYTEPGNIIIKAKSSLANAIIGGTQINDDFQKLNLLLKPYRERSAKASKAFDAVAEDQQKDINNIAAYRAQMKKIADEMAPVQFGFIAAHPKSYISVLTLKQMLGNKEMLPQIYAAYLNLATHTKKSKEGLALEEMLLSLKKSEPGSMAYNFMLPGVDGKPVSLSDFKGKYILVDFWASWCQPCREQNPNLIFAYNKFRGLGFEILGVSIENYNEKNNWLAAIQKDNLPWPQVLDGAPNQTKVKTLYGIQRIPSNMLIDPNGKILAKDLQDIALINKLTDVLNK